ncbi:MAG: AIR synthase-related protein [Actinomycetota bacterium]
MHEVGAAAATDVTGFGLLGHLLEMLDGRLSARLTAGAIPVLVEAYDLAAAGVLPAGSKRNREAGADLVVAEGLSEEGLAVLFDAQTSGGLLIASLADRTPALMDALGGRGVSDAVVIGTLLEGRGRIEVTA